MARNRALPGHLLVIRSSAMGDVAMVPHALRALHAAYPDLKITVATRELFRPFFEGSAADLLPVDTKGAHRTIAGLLAYASQAAASGIDGVADLHGVLRSHVIRTALALRGIPTAVIRKGRREKRALMGYGEIAPPLKHTVTRYCDVFRRLGFRLDDPQPAPRAVRPNPMGIKRGLWVGMAPFSAHAGKTYPADLAEEVVRRLSIRCERIFIHSGGGREAQWAQHMERLCENVTALHGRIKGLGEEMDLIANLDCIVSMDSLAMHMASLVGTPVVSVWGATHPSLGFLGYGCDPSGIVQLSLSCRPCSVYGKRPCKLGDYRCLRGILPESIVACVERVSGVAVY